MLKAAILLFLGAFLAGCQGEVTGAGSDGVALPTGNYRVLRTDGFVVSAPHKVTLSVGANRIQLHSQCVTPSWSYRWENARIVTETIPEPVCERGRYPFEKEAILVLDQPVEAVTYPSGNIVLRGANGTIELGSINADLPESESILLDGDYRIAEIDGIKLDRADGAILTAGDDEIWWDPRCARLIVQYRIEGNRFIPIPPQRVMPAPPGAELPPARTWVVCTVRPPQSAAQAISALSVGERIERFSVNSVWISGGGRSVTLQRDDR